MTKAMNVLDTLAFACMLDTSINVIVVYPTHLLYENIKQLFDNKGNAFLMPDKRLIVIDGDVVQQPWFTKNHLLIIEAHELGHLYTKTDDERTADIFGYKLLRKKNKLNAAKIYARLIYDRYKITIN